MGFFIAIEGIDGSGKGTQTEMLRSSFQTSGINTETITFPRYTQTQIGPQIGKFLNGCFGPLEHSHPIPMSLMYAAERFESRGLIQSQIEKSELLIADRYTGSNLAHQGARLSGDEQTAFLEWITNIEYSVFDVPRPDLVIVLDLPAESSAERVARKRPRDYTEQVTDLHESNLEYLTAVQDLYRHLCDARPYWRKVSCLTPDGKDRSPEEIHDELRALLLQEMPSLEAKATS